MNNAGSYFPLYRTLADRCRSLEASYKKLEEQFEAIMQGQRAIDLRRGITSSAGVSKFPGYYKRVLDSIGHAIFVCRVFSQEIIFWNPSADKLFGYKDHEVLGQRGFELLIHDDHRVLAEKFMGSPSDDLFWSGQFPFRKRSGDIFMALVNKSPLYENGELAGIITVLSDATVFNTVNLGNLRTYQDPDNGPGKVRGINLRKIHWHPQLQISSFVSHLASRETLQKNGANSCNTCSTSVSGEDNILESRNIAVDSPPQAPPAKPSFDFRTWKRTTTNADSSAQNQLAQPSKLAAKVLSKLWIGETRNLKKDDDSSMQQDASVDISVGNVLTSCITSKATILHHCVADVGHNQEKSHRWYSPYVAKICENANVNEQIFPTINHLEKSGLEFDKMESMSKSVPEQANLNKYSSSDDSNNTAPSRRGEYDLGLVADCGIRWEDLNFKEEIGHGSCAVVYRGIWNGSDVAIKVLFGNHYAEDTLLDYKKEIDIMRRLRHPNVLLFMGAVCSQEKLAIVTELLTRGSLFKLLHKNTQLLDIKRRLRMALDVARGMNYLHHRNPPIVHRDLKSSNLLVDKNWSVKVGDFGMSKLKDATFLTARSGRGTPQWMAPEVLRNEPSNEKSDVYSFGVILWELVTNSVPWSDLNPLQVVGVVGFMDRRLDVPEALDPTLSSIIHDCWQSKPEYRPSFETIMVKMTDLIKKNPTSLLL